MKKSWSLIIENKLKVIPILILIIGTTFTLLLNYNSSIIQDYNNAIHLTDRQSVLIREISSKKEMNVAFNQSMLVFEEGLKILKNGGADKINKENYFIPEIKDKNYQNKIDEIEKASSDLIETEIKSDLNRSKDSKSNLTISESTNSIIKNFETLINILNQKKGIANQWQSILFISMFSIMSFLIFLYIQLFNKYYNKPIRKIINSSRLVAKGELSNKVNYKSNDDIGEIAEYIDQIIENQIKLTSFAKEIEEGKLASNYKKLSDGDTLGITLLGMCDKLQRVSAEEKRRNWSNEGLAKFAEILRSENNTRILSEKLLQNLIKYTNANQGGIFILQEEVHNNKYLSLEALYAWDRKKFIEERIEIGEGLIGQAALEGETIYVTEIPNKFIRITSGLGEANPSSILIVPLKVNDSVQGVLEMAYFRNLEKHEIEFVEKLSESIASTISSVKINENTLKLLDESRRMTQEMKSQEEEMRQNMEELQATQEALKAKEETMLKYVQEIEAVKGSLSEKLEEAKGEMKIQIMQLETERTKNVGILEGCVDGVITFNQNGIIEFFNKSAEEIWGYNREEIIGESIYKLISLELNSNNDGGFSAYYLDKNEKKSVSVRTEISIINKSGIEVPVLVTLSKTKIEAGYYFSIFVQSIAVELF